MSSLSLVVLGMMITASLSAQNLTDHQWQDRLVILLTDDLQSPLITEQLSVFREEADGMKERKLIIYRVSPTAWEKGLSLSFASHSHTPPTIYQRFNPTEAPFQVVLIGLDGGTKWRVNEVISCDDLFALIDGMPMRRAELRRNRER